MLDFISSAKNTAKRVASNKDVQNAVLDTEVIYLELDIKNNPFHMHYRVSNKNDEC